MPTYEAAGLRTVYIGDEAVVDPRTFSLEGRAIRKVRQSVNRLEKAGYSVIVRRRDELTPELLSSLLRVSQLWLGGQPERGFSMAMDDLWAPEHASAVFAIALAADGRPHGFIHFVPVPRARSLSLSAMRRLPDTPNGLMEYVLCETFAWGRDNDVERVSLNFNAFGELLRSEEEDLPAWERMLKIDAREGRPVLPGGAAARVQPQVLPALGAAPRRVRAAPRPAARGDRAADGRVAGGGAAPDRQAVAQIAPRGTLRVSRGRPGFDVVC